MSNNYNPQGSEKIQDPDKKLNRILEIAGISHKPTVTDNNRHNTNLSTVLHEAVAADGQTYGLIQEGPKVYLKKLVNERYEYYGSDEKQYAYKDFAQAFKHMNFIFKDISINEGHSSSINIFEGGLNEKKKLTEERFILKTPGGQAPPSQDVTPPAPAENPLADPGMPPANPEASQELGQEFNSAEDAADEQDPAKAIQKLTGKLTEKMRTADESVMTSEFMKTILNSVISAIKVPQMEDADVLSVIKKLKGEENPESAAPDAPGGSGEFSNSEGIDYNTGNDSDVSPNEIPMKEEDNQSGTHDYPGWPGYQQSKHRQDIPGATNNPTTFGALGKGAEFIHNGEKCMKWDKYNYVHPSGKIQSMDASTQVEQDNATVAELSMRSINEEVTEPTWDDQVMPDILQQVVHNVGIEVNPSTENDVNNAVKLFVGTYDSDNNQTEFMHQLKDYLTNAKINTGSAADQQIKYSTLSPMGQQVYDQLEIIDPSMGELNQNPDDVSVDPERDNSQSFQTQTNQTTLMAAESNFIKGVIIEALKN